MSSFFGSAFPGIALFPVYSSLMTARARLRYVSLLGGGKSRKYVRAYIQRSPQTDKSMFY